VVCMPRMLLLGGDSPTAVLFGGFMG
jgi:hypothetical protein